MGVTGDGRDQLEVVGDGVDTVCLVKCLRRKLGHADILKVEEVKDKKPEEKKPEEPKIIADPPPYCYPGYYYHHHHLPAPVTPIELTPAHSVLEPSAPASTEERAREQASSEEKQHELAWPAYRLLWRRAPWPWTGSSRTPCSP